MRNEVSNELSTDINVITAEINAYQRVAGEAIFEIGRRLKWVRDSLTDSVDPAEVKIAKERELAGGWIKWLAENVGIDRSTANKFIRVYEELSEDVGTYPRLGLRALYEIATLPPEAREVEHELPSGESKKPEDMTVKELRELKKALKQAEQQADIERRERERLEEENEQLAEKADKPPEYIEVIPDDYEQLKKEREELERKLKEANPFSEEPYGVKLGLAIYDAFEELSKWQKEYSWIVTDITEFRKLIEADPNFAREFSRLDKFWQQMSGAFHGLRSKGTYREESETAEIIDVEFTEVI